MGKEIYPFFDRCVQLYLSGCESEELNTVSCDVLTCLLSVSCVLGCLNVSGSADVGHWVLSWGFGSQLTEFAALVPILRLFCFITVHVCKVAALAIM